VRLTRVVPQSVTVGVLATLSMDAFFVAASRLGGERFTSDLAAPELVGRWTVGLVRGQYRHQDITQEPAQAGEAAVGMAVHYLTGIILTQAYLGALSRGRLRPSIVSATAYGIATALLPTLIMYPSWGLGPFALRSDEASRLLRIMLLGHTVFGAAIGLWTGLLSRRDGM
jgi:hypothetical protein